MSQQILNGLFWATFFLLTVGSFVFGFNARKLYEGYEGLQKAFIYEGLHALIAAILACTGAIMYIVIATHVVIAP